MRCLTRLLPLLAVLPLAAFTEGDPIAHVALYLAIILVAAKLGGDLAVRAGQSAVLGELIAGVALGNAALLGVPWFTGIASDTSIDMLARLGVLILLFEVGLESTVQQMLKVGVAATVVAFTGVATPFALGWMVSAWLMPHASPYVHMFLGATLTATSVGITARVLQDLGRAQQQEARIILGAAVIDDVLGLVILGVATGLIGAAASGRQVGAGGLVVVVAKAGAFLVGAIALGVWAMPRVLKAAGALRAPSVLIATGLVLCFLLAWLSSVVGLAPIVGAFAAGLILERVHYQPFTARGEHGLEDLIHPVAGFLVPVFFVLMGMRTDLGAFTHAGVVELAAALTLVAVIGKLACGLVIPRGLDRLSVGIGMIPRGEVGLIFANIGLGLVVAGEEIVTPAIYSAVVVMVIVTTMMTPPLLQWSFARRSSVHPPA